MNRLLLALLVLICIWVAPSFANEKEQKLALLEAAVEGDANAQYELASIYALEAFEEEDDFEPAPKPWGKSLHWYESAAAQGHIRARYALLSRMDFQQDKWFELAYTMAESGDKYAQYHLARLFSARCHNDYNVCFLQASIRWYTELLKGTEKKKDEEDILPKSLTLTRRATIGDIKQSLNNFKKIATRPSSLATGKVFPADSRLYVEDVFVCVLVEQFGVKTENLFKKTNLQKDLGADELDLTELCMGLEDYLDITIPDKKWADVTTIKSAVDLLFDILDSEGW